MKLELFHMDRCPYCIKVRNYLATAGLTQAVPLSEINADPAKRAELMKMNGDPQVPCLVIDGKPMLESDDIIAWFKEHRSEILH